MVGGLMFMGFAGTAAAQDINIDTDAITGGDAGDGGDAAAETVQDFDQTNVNEQVGEASSESVAASAAVSDGDGQAAANDGPKDKGTADDFAGAGAESTAVSESTAAVGQSQDVEQGNAIDADATTAAEGGDGGDGGDAGVGVDVDIDFDDFDGGIGLLA
ncbi:hypothetical protein [Natronorubrum sp. DTA7]|uniref:hypothetical protein n=1 Tax=Natronorubrum sp. DTA7 TaxID=3447016 RepID=UPI003F863F2D